MKSYETEPIEEATDVDQVSERHELVRLGMSPSDTSSTIEDEPPRRRKLFRPPPPTREQLLLWIPFWGVILLGAILRFWALGDKPLHHDESLHAYYSLQLLQNMAHWGWCVNPPPQGYSCYTYTPLLHGPFQFHFIALVYKISQLLGAPDNGVNTTSVRILAATLGSAIVALPYFLRDYLGKVGAWLACLLLAVSPSMVYFSRFAREDIYMAFFTLVMVVGVARYIRERKMRWLVIAAAGLLVLVCNQRGDFLDHTALWELPGRLDRLGTRPENVSARTFQSGIALCCAPTRDICARHLAGIFRCCRDSREGFVWLGEVPVSLHDRSQNAASC